MTSERRDPGWLARARSWRPSFGRGLPQAVILLGFTSLFTDLSSDLITPLLPAFVVGVLGARTTMLGVIEGLADAVSAAGKYVSGWLSDRARRRKPLIVAGYALASLTRPLMALALAPWHVLSIRVVDRIGKGLRSSPRDALIADAAPAGQAGRAFGFHRAMDHAGAVLGPLLAALLLALGMELRHVFMVAVIPAILALACAVAVREPPRSIPPAGHGSVEGSAPLPRRLRSLLVVVLVFSLAASSDMFVLLRAQEIGVPLALIPLLAAAMSLVKMAWSPVAGAWSDRFGRLPLVVSGWLAYAASYAALAFASSPWAAAGIVLLYGTYHGLTEATERALVADLAPVAARGRAYGAYNAVIASAALPAGLLTGVLWDRFSSGVALLACAGLSLLATAMLVAWAARR